jgi:hypothetical protein
MGDRGFNAGGFAYMPIIQYVRCGAKFRIDNKDPRRECANREKCDRRRNRKAGEKEAIDG